MRKRFTRQAALLGAVVFGAGGAFLGPRAQGQNYTWDPLQNTTGSDGGGVWDTGTVWANGSDNAWSNSTADTAVIGSGGGGGTITLSGATVSTGGITFNSVTSPYTISGTTLSFGAVNGAISVAAGAGNPVINSVLAGTAGITVSGGGTVTFGNAANTFTGGLMVTGAGTQVDYNALASIPTANAITLDNGGILVYNGTASSPTQTNIYNFTNSGGTINILPTFNTGTGTNTAGKFTMSTANQLRGDGNLTKAGLGNITIGNSNPNFSGEIVITNGVITQNYTGGVLGAIMLTGSTTNNLTTGFAELNMNGSVSGASITDVSGVTVPSGSAGIIGIENANGTFKSTPITANGTLVFQLGNFYSASGNFSLTLDANSPLSGSGTIGFMSAGGESVVNPVQSKPYALANSSGQSLTLKGDDSAFSGTITIGDAAGVTGGTGYVVNANSTTALGTGSVVMTSLGTLNINAIQSMGGLSGAAGSVNIASSDVLTVTTSGAFAGAIKGAGGLTVAGGTMNLSGAGNNYTGATSVTSGTLELSGSGALGNTAVTVSPAAVLAVLPGSSITNTVGGSVSLLHSGSLNMSGDSATSILAIGGGLTIGDGITDAPSLSFDLGSSAGAIDNLVVTGAVTVDPTFGGSININPLSTDTSLTPGTYNLISAASATDLAELTLPGAVGGFELINVGGNNYNLSLTQSGSVEQLVVSNVPEPTLTGLMGLGVLILGSQLTRRRRTMQPA